MEHGIVYTPKKHYKKKSLQEKSWFCAECFKGWVFVTTFTNAVVSEPTEKKCPHKRHNFLSSNNHVGAGGEM